MIRDWKTGRFAEKWKARRYPKRFSEKPPGILESERTRTAKELKKYLKSKQGRRLKKSFDTGRKNIRIVKDRHRKGIFLVELPFGGERRRGRGTPKAISLRVNLKKGIKRRVKKIASK